MINTDTPINNDSPFVTDSQQGGNPTKPNSVSKESWDRYMHVYDYAKNKGDKFPEVFASQAALESGWFKHSSGNNNYFGQKAKSSEAGTIVNTKEQGKDGLYKTKAKFKDYNSFEEALDDRYNRWSYKYQNSKDTSDAINNIANSGYATDKNYGKKLNDMIKSVGANSVNEGYQPPQQFQPQSQIQPQFNQPIQSQSGPPLPSQPIQQEFEQGPPSTEDIRAPYKSDTPQQSPQQLSGNETASADQIQKENYLDFTENYLANINPATPPTNTKAYGGSINASESINTFEGGGSHEANSLGGIPQGIGQNGKTNTVEEGETSIELTDGKYVFSDRIKI